MIKCNRCGKMNPAGTTNCQQCGAALSNNFENSPRMGAQGQPELPAWLESLRAGEGPVAPINQPANFPADLIEEGALPNWMRSQRDETNDFAPTGPHYAVAAPGFSGPQGNGYPPQGIAAQSLIDEQSLPSWMQGGDNASRTAVSPEGLSAASLVEQDSLPDWMKTLQQEQAPAMPPASPVVPPTPSAMPPRTAAPPTSGISGMAAPSASAPISQGFSARDLIDPQALPNWMTQQNAQQNTQQNGPSSGVHSTGTPPVPNTTRNSGVMTPNTPQAPAQGFSASSLLDMNSLPPWMSEAGMEQGGNTNGNALPPAPSAPATPYQSGAWQGAASTMPSAQAPQQGSGISASSFVDMNALPDWLRSAAGQPAGTGTPAQPSPMSPPPSSPFPPPNSAAGRPGSLPVPPRVENMRVPSRPRSELNANENNEVAANVFASMLGVASAAPQYPSAQAPSPYQQPGPGGQPGTPQVPGMPPTSIGNLIGGTPPGSGQGPMGTPGMPPQGYPTGNPGGVGGMGNNSGVYGNPGNGVGGSGIYGNPAGGAGGSGIYGNPAGGSGVYGGYANGTPNNYQTAAPIMPPGSEAGAMPGASDEQKNKKRGLVEALRDWLFR